MMFSKNTSVVNYKIVELIKLKIICAYRFFMFIIAVSKDHDPFFFFFINWYIMINLLYNVISKLKVCNFTK